MTALADDGGTPVETTTEYIAREANGDVVASPYKPLGLVVNGRDIGHLRGPGWYFNNAFDVHLTNDTEYVLSGQSIDTGRAGRIGFDVDANANVTLSNLVLNLNYVHTWGTSDTYGRAKSAISIPDGMSSTITLAGTNTIVTGLGAGVHVPSNANVTFRGAGFLNITGGDYYSQEVQTTWESCGAGIGGIYGETSGTIEIDLDEGGEIVAKGGSSSAGIGGAQADSSGKVVVRGGTVTAIGEDGAAGIGGGYGYFENGRVCGD